MTSQKIALALDDLRATMRRHDADRRSPAEPVEKPKPPRKSKTQQLEEHDRAARKFRASQPLQIVALRPETPSERGLTVRAAYRLIVEHGGSVEPGPHGTLVFRLPELVDPGPGASYRRQKLVRACELVDACRPIVFAALSNGDELPDAVAAVGGGVAQ